AEPAAARPGPLQRPRPARERPRLRADLPVVADGERCAAAGPGHGEGEAAAPAGGPLERRLSDADDGAVPRDPAVRPADPADAQARRDQREAERRAADDVLR